MQIVIIAGGKGTRLKKIFPNTPKILLPTLPQKKIIDHYFEEFKSNDIFLSLGHHHEKIKTYLMHKKKNFKFFVEKKPLGTFGALKAITLKYEKNFKSKILVILGDLLISNFKEYQLNRLHNLIKKKKNYFFYTINENPEDSDRISINKNNDIIKIQYKHKVYKKKGNKTLSGMYLLNKSDIINFKKKSGDIALDFLKYLTVQKKAKADHLLCDMRDIGTEKRYNKLVNSNFFKKRKYFIIVLNMIDLNDLDRYKNSINKIARKILQYDIFNSKFILLVEADKKLLLSKNYFGKNNDLKIDTNIFLQEIIYFKNIFPSKYISNFETILNKISDKWSTNCMNAFYLLNNTKILKNKTKNISNFIQNNYCNLQNIDNKNLLDFIKKN